MLFHVDDEGFRVELSLPDAIVEGRITSCAERIILPVFPRDDDRLAATAAGRNDGQMILKARSAVRRIT